MLLRRGLALVIIVSVAFQIQTCLSQINRASFPKGFVFGTASSAFQVRFILLIDNTFYFRKPVEPVFVR
jgi:hypothetical protein